MVNGGYIEKLLLARLLMAVFLQNITKKWLIITLQIFFNKNHL